jgi:signal transduction histidine kinase
VKKDEAPSWKEWLALSLKSADTTAWLLDLTDKAHPTLRIANETSLMGWKDGQSWSMSEFLLQVHPQDRPKMEKEIHALLNGTQTELDQEHRIIGSDRQVHWVHAQGRSTRASDGRVIRIAGLTTDISDTKKMKLTHEQFVATLSHEIRNPLASAKAYIGLLQEFGDRIQDPREFLRKVSAAIDRADGIIQTLLDWSRAEAGLPLRLSIRTCDLRKEFSETVADLATLYGERFQFEASGDFRGKWACNAICRVLENLLTNAVKYGAENGTIQVRMVRNPQFVSFSVHNEGNPISPEEQKHLFDPYFRTKSPLANVKEGTGLGLTFVKQIAGSLHGDIHVESGPEIGTTFQFQFPISQEVPEVLSA